MSRRLDEAPVGSQAVQYEIPVAMPLLDPGPGAASGQIDHGKPDAEPVEAAKDHRVGHRKRLRERFLAAGPEGIAPYELLELILFQAQPRSDKKALAKTLIDRFGSFAEVMTAPAERLREVDGIGDAAITAFRIIEAAAQQLVKGSVAKRVMLGSWSAVRDYCRARMAFAQHEEFRVLFLDKRNMLIRDEVHGHGTVDHTPVYPRNIIKRALELNASALILVHNHPSGDPSPSQSDVSMTKQIATLARAMEIDVLDHLIVGRNGYESLRRLKML